MSNLFGISPWWWIALAILLAALEMVTVTLVLVWSALAAAITGIVLWLAPGLSGEAQIAIFGLLSIGFTFAGRWLVGRYGDFGGRAAKLNRRAEQLVGREGVVLSFVHREGQVRLDGTPWPARLEGDAATPLPGDVVRVVATDGIVVRVTPLPARQGATAASG